MSHVNNDTFQKISRSLTKVAPFYLGPCDTVRVPIPPSWVEINFKPAVLGLVPSRTITLVPPLRRR